MEFIIAIALIILFVFIFAVVPVSFAAKWLKANRCSFRWSFLAILATMLIGGGASFVARYLSVSLGALAYPFLLIVDIAVPSFCYAWILDTPSFWRGLGIYLLSTVMTIGMTLAVLIIIFVLSMLTGIGQTELNNFSFSKFDMSESASEFVGVAEMNHLAQQVCACGADTQCLHERGQAFNHQLKQLNIQHYSADDKRRVAAMMSQALHCINKPSEKNAALSMPGDVKSGNHLQQTSTEQTATSSEEDGLSPRERALQRERLAQQKAAQAIKLIIIDIADVAKYPGRPAVILLQDGRTKEGVISNTSRTTVSLKQLSHGGFITSHIRVSDIQEIRIKMRADQVNETAKP